MRHDSSKKQQKKLFHPSTQTNTRWKKRLKLYPMPNLSEIKFCSLGSNSLSHLSNIYYLIRPKIATECSEVCQGRVPCEI